MAAQNTHDQEEAIYGNSDTILFHHLTISGDLIGTDTVRRDHHAHEEEVPRGEHEHDGYEEEDNMEEVDEVEDSDYDDFSSDEEEADDTGQPQQITPQGEHTARQMQGRNIQGWHRENQRSSDCQPSSMPSTQETTASTSDYEDDYLTPLKKTTSTSLQSEWPKKPSNAPHETKIGHRWQQHFPSPSNNQPMGHHMGHGNGVPWGKTVTTSPIKKDMPGPSAMVSASPHPHCNGWRLGPLKPSGGPPKKGLLVLPLKRIETQNKEAIQRSHSSPQQSTPARKVPNGPLNSTAPSSPMTLPPSMALPSMANGKKIVEKGGDAVTPSSFLQRYPSLHGPQNSRTTPGSDLRGRASTPSALLENGERIILTPLYQKILEKPYFHLVSRDFAKELVKNGGDGTFVIRPSVNSGKPLTLTVAHNNKLFHLNIRQRTDGLFALGSQKQIEKTFSTINEIVSHYHNLPIRLNNGVELKLKYSPRKTSNAYVHHTVTGSRRNQPVCD